MGKLGISIYPERSTFEADKAYLDLAHQYGFKRVFTSLLEINGDKDEAMRALIVNPLVGDLKTASASSAIFSAIISDAP